MEKIQALLEKYLAPLGVKIGGNKYLQVVQKSFLAVMPLTIAGSIALIISYFPFIDKVVPETALVQIVGFFSAISGATLSLIALFLAGAIGYYLTRAEGNEELFGTTVTICCFLILTPGGTTQEGIGYIPTTWLGGQGLLVAIICGFLGGSIYNKLLTSKTTIKLPDTVPPMVAAPFKMLIPAFTTFIIFAALRFIMAATPYGDIHSIIFSVLQKPLMALGTSLPASIIVVISVQLLWFVGLHGQNIVSAVINPLWYTAMIANLTAVQNGQAPEYIFTAQFFTGFIWIQFTSLILACMVSARSAQLKSVSKLAFGSACFNISEPIVFGAPIVLNFMLLIPWVLNMVIFVIVTWAAMKFGICPKPLGAYIPWTTPPILSGWLVTGSPMGALVQIVNFAIGFFVYLPFVKVYDKQLAAQEAAGSEEQMI